MCSVLLVLLRMNYPTHFQGMNMPSLIMYRHPVEAMLRWTGWAYYIYITIVPDLILMPIVKGLFDKKARLEYGYNFLCIVGHKNMKLILKLSIS